MRELRQDWRDIFYGFRIALHPAKMFLGFMGIVLSVLAIYLLLAAFRCLMPGSSGVRLVPFNFLLLGAWVSALVLLLYLIYRLPMIGGFSLKWSKKKFFLGLLCLTLVIFAYCTATYYLPFITYHQEDGYGRACRAIERFIVHPVAEVERRLAKRTGREVTIKRAGVDFTKSLADNPTGTVARKVRDTGFLVKSKLRTATADADNLLFSVLAVLLLLFIWSAYGGAITRIAAVEYAKDERIELSEARKFIAGKYWSYFWAPLISVIGIIFFGIWVWGFALFGRIPWLNVGVDVVLALGLIAALVAGFLIVLIAIGGIFGLRLMFPTISAEGTDAFDGISRAFSYVYSKPWRYIVYNVAAIAYGAVCIAFVGIVACLMFNVTLDMASWGRNPEVFSSVRDFAVGKKTLDEVQDIVKSRLEADIPAARLKGKLNPNDAGRKKLALLSQIDEKLAIAIKKYSDENKKENEGVFKEAEDLLKVKGMNEKKLEAIKGRLTFEEETSLAEVSIVIDPDDAEDMRSSGYIKVGGEAIGYNSRDGKGKLGGIKRGQLGTSASDHKEGTRVIGYKESPHLRIMGVILRVYYYIVWLAVGGFAAAYIFTARTIIYFLMRKRVDDIDCNEVYEEEEEEEEFAPPPAPAPAAEEEAAEGEEPAGEAPTGEEAEEGVEEGEAAVTSAGVAEKVAEAIDVTCDNCGKLMKPGGNVQLVIDGVEQQFCSKKCLDEKLGLVKKKKTKKKKKKKKKKATGGADTGAETPSSES